jgi:hypothetical protein
LALLLNEEEETANKKKTDSVVSLVFTSRVAQHIVETP